MKFTWGKPPEPTLQELAQGQLDEAERQLLEAEAEEERAKHNKRMLTERVERLRHQVAPAAALASIPKTILKAAA